MRKTNSFIKFGCHMCSTELFGWPWLTSTFVTGLRSMYVGASWRRFGTRFKLINHTTPQDQPISPAQCVFTLRAKRNHTDGLRCNFSLVIVCRQYLVQFRRDVQRMFRVRAHPCDVKIFLLTGDSILHAIAVMSTNVIRHHPGSHRCYSIVMKFHNSPPGERLLTN